MRKFLLLVSVTTISACASSGGKPVPQAPVAAEVKPAMPRFGATDSAEYAPFQKPGTASIEGEAFLKTRGGDVKTAAGNVVLLDPKTAFFDQWLAFTRDMKATLAMSIAAPVPNSLRRRTTADSRGHFVFSNLPAGTYYVRTVVSWLVPTLGEQGGVVGALVTVADGDRKSAIITGKSY